MLKCMSINLANRLEGCLNLYISPSQTDFNAGRKIAENVLLAQELTKTIIEMDL